jgi:L,D-transpeptidase YcbB
MPPRPLLAVLAAALACASLIGCSGRTGDAERWSAHVRAALASEQLSGSRGERGAMVRDTVDRFYERRNHQPAWLERGYPAERALSAIGLLERAGDDGLEPELYEVEALRARHAELAERRHRGAQEEERETGAAAFDVRLSSALAAFGADLAHGRIDPASIDAAFKAERREVDLAAALALADDGEGERFLAELRPPHPEYEALRLTLIGYRTRAAEGPWPSVDARRALRPGTRDAAVAALRARLRASHELPDSAVLDSPLFDEDVEAGVRAFQDHHGIRATGIVDETTRAALNVPLEVRLAQIALNLERWRWLPATLGDPHIRVNIPQYRLEVRRGGQPELSMRAIVGKEGDETPVFSDRVSYIVFSPYWNVPPSIAAQVTIPALLEDPVYLERNQMEVVRRGRSGPEVVDASLIDLGDPAAREGLSFRQRPGPHNSLGLVKFMFPNELNVYIHDTPAGRLFNARDRALSHGCVRVEEPVALARYLLQDQQEWTEAAIREAMQAGIEKQVNLGTPVPVHLVYWTAWVDDAGGVHFREDAYGHDARQRSVTERQRRQLIQTRLRQSGGAAATAR